MTKATFERNYAGKSTYKCGCCGRNTRDTGLGELSCELCAFCYEASGQENAYSDGAITGAQLNAVMDDLNKQYGKKAHVGCVAHVEEAPVATVKSRGAKLIKAAVDKAIANGSPVIVETTYGPLGCKGIQKDGITVCKMPASKDGSHLCFNHKKAVV